MAAGDVVVIDAAGEYSMYASDLTRTMPVDGHFTARQKEIYNIVLGAQQAARDAFVAGKSKMGSSRPSRGRCRPKLSLDKVAFDYINTHGKDLHGDPLGKYFLHALGHSVGIDVHDPYDYDKPFDIGSVFTIEPGSTFQKRRSASASKTRSTSTLRASSLTSQKNCPTRRKTLRRLWPRSRRRKA